MIKLSLILFIHCRKSKPQKGLINPRSETILDFKYDYIDCCSNKEGKIAFSARHIEAPDIKGYKGI